MKTSTFFSEVQQIWIWGFPQLIAGNLKNTFHDNVPELKQLN